MDQSTSGESNESAQTGKLLPREPWTKGFCSVMDPGAREEEKGRGLKVEKY